MSTSLLIIVNKLKYWVPGLRRLGAVDDMGLFVFVVLGADQVVITFAASPLVPIDILLGRMASFIQS